MLLPAHKLAVRVFGALYPGRGYWTPAVLYSTTSLSGDTESTALAGDTESTALAGDTESTALDGSL